MLSRFLQFGNEHDLFEGENKILLAVSGGLDSIVMVELFLRAGIPFSVAHCNFNLRGKESDADADFVKNLARKHAIKFHTKKFNTDTYSRKNKVSTQVAARELRYTWFSEILQKENYRSLATAHHLDDSIETFFINLLRGTGIKGLTGIPIKTDEYIRPLSTFSRKEILAFAKKEKLKWREDSSNASDDYFRNRIRHKLIPILENLQPEFQSVMQKNFENLRQSAALQAELTSSLTTKFLISTGKNKWKLNIPSLKKESEATAKLQLILNALGLKSTNVESIIGSNKPGKFFYSGGLRMLRDRNELIIERGSEASLKPVSLTGSDEDFHYENLHIQVKTLKLMPGQDVSKEPSIQQLDAKKLSFPLLIRPWMAGDFFYPLGMKNKKKVSDFLIDNKVNRIEKENCLVLLSGTDIVCILGHRIDERYKVTESTQYIFTLTINKL